MKDARKRGGIRFRPICAALLCALLLFPGGASASTADDAPPDYSRMALTELSVRFDSLSFSFGESRESVLGKANEAGILFEQFGDNPNYYYFLHDPARAVTSDIGLGFNGDGALHYVGMAGIGTLQDRVSNAMAFRDLVAEFGRDDLNVAVYGGKVITIVYLWRFEHFYIEATAYPLSMPEIETDERPLRIEVYAPELFPLHVFDDPEKFPRIR